MSLKEHPLGVRRQGFGLFWPFLCSVSSGSGAVWRHVCVVSLFFGDSTSTGSALHPCSLLLPRAQQCWAAMDLLNTLLGDVPGGGCFSSPVWGHMSPLSGRSVGPDTAPGLTLIWVKLLPPHRDSFVAPKPRTVSLWRRNGSCYCSPRKGISTPTLDTQSPLKLDVCSWVF